VISVPPSPSAGCSRKGILVPQSGPEGKARGQTAPTINFTAYWPKGVSSIGRLIIGHNRNDISAVANPPGVANIVRRAVAGSAVAVIAISW
jgi:hypothetical protein